MTMGRTSHKVRHDCKWSDEVLEVIAALNLPPLKPEERTMDPFAGAGESGSGWTLLQALGATEADLIGLDIEPEWADSQPWIRQGDALDILAYPAKVARIVTSPTYGNRMSGNYLGPVCLACRGSGLIETGGPCETCEGSGHDGTGRFGYAISLNRKLSDRSSSLFGWGKSYRDFHREWLDLAARVLPEGENRLVVNMSDHYRNRERQYVVDWWIVTASRRGFKLASAVPAATQRFGMGRNSQDRAPAEMVLVFDRVKS